MVTTRKRKQQEMEDQDNNMTEPQEGKMEDMGQTEDVEKPVQWTAPPANKLNIVGRVVKDMTLILIAAILGAILSQNVTLHYPYIPSRL